MPSSPRLWASSGESGCSDTPIQPRTTLPLSTSWSTTRFTMLIGMANPIPCPAATIAVLIPMTSPFRFTSGPPELPGLMEASVWMKFSYVAMPTSERPVALMTPDGDGLVQPEGVADGDGPLPDTERVRVPERRHRQRMLVGLEAHHRQVRLGVGAEDLAAVLALVREPDDDLIRSLDDVKVGEHEAALVEDDPGAEPGLPELRAAGAGRGLRSRRTG